MIKLNPTKVKDDTSLVGYFNVYSSHSKDRE